MTKVNKIEIRMYKMGTGDCFALKFMTGNNVTFKMLIDAGTWSGTTERLTPYVKDLLEYLEHKVNVLVVTHEHKDHVHAFHACKDLFAGEQPLVADEVWMGWTENDRLKKVKEFKEKYGEKKMALDLAARQFNVAIKSDEFKKQFEEEADGDFMYTVRENFSGVLNSFVELHVSDEGVYKGGLKGMEVIKKEIGSGKLRYFGPGDIIEKIQGATGIKFYILGPPRFYEDIKKEKGKGDESYPHNDTLKESNSFAAAILQYDITEKSRSLLPFSPRFIQPAFESDNPPEDSSSSVYAKYCAPGAEWRRIDYEWLLGGASLALRMNSFTNNLSLAMAIEFEDSGRVLLFPGDAEYGSWASWHQIDWKDSCRNGKQHLTEDLLSRTVFYKVAHHLSHNGTAKRLGLDMMEHRDLVAMATLDYDVISDGWINTMPNLDILKTLLTKTKGRLLVMNTEGLYVDFNEELPLEAKIQEARSAMSAKELLDFKSRLQEEKLYTQFIVSGK